MGEEKKSRCRKRCSVRWAFISCRSAEAYLDGGFYRIVIMLNLISFLRYLLLVLESKNTKNLEGGPQFLSLPWYIFVSACFVRLIYCMKRKITWWLQKCHCVEEIFYRNTLTWLSLCIKKKSVLMLISEESLQESGMIQYQLQWIKLTVTSFWAIKSNY